MPKVKFDQKAPDFELSDFAGKKFRLSDSFCHQNTLLVFNRGFI